MADAQITPDPPKKRSWVAFFAAHPTFGFVCGLASLISIPLSVFLYFASAESRNLSTYLSQTTTTIVKSGQSSDLSVYFKNQALKTDVSAIQIGIWNAGKQAIRPENVLEPIVIRTVPRVPILEARISHVNRSLSAPALDLSKTGDGQLGVSWKILERNDGFVIQAIIAGATDTSLDVAGVVEGQAALSKMRSANDNDMRHTATFLVCTIVAGIISWNIVGIASKPWSAKGGAVPALLGIAVPIITIIIAMFLAQQLSSTAPPLPFDISKGR